MDAVDVAKTVSIVILGLFAFCLGMLPIIIVKKLHWRPSENGMSPMAQSILSGILCFGGGVLMATSLIHLLPEIQRGFEELQKTGEISTRMPLGEIMFAAGFFFVYFVEECVHYLSAHHHRKQSETSSIVQMKQPVSDLADHDGKSQSSCSSECDMRQLAVDQDTEKNCTDSAGSQHDDQDAGHHHHGFVEGGGDGLATLRGFLIVVGLSIHGIFEGLAVGLEKEARDVWMLCGAISIHKFVIAICIGLEMASSGVNIVAHALYLFIFSLVTPLGIGIGMAVIASSASSDNLTEDELPSLILSGLASGTIIYVAFFEILERERARINMRLLQLACLIVGFLFMLTIESFAQHEEQGHHNNGTAKSIMDFYVPQ